MNKAKRYTVTAALPYTNGGIHIGHLAGVYVPGDVYVRYLRLQKQDVIYICGSDEHGVPITIKAKKEGISPQQLVDKYDKIIKESFEKFGISFDNYSRTSSDIHHKTASEFFTKLEKDGKFIVQTEKQYFDTSANQFLADRYITGTCPKCGSEGAYGDQCEKCGSTLSPSELLNPKSALSGQEPILKETKHWYLPLQRYDKWLREWILEGHKNDWKPNVYGQVKSWLDDGLRPRAVTRDLDWGINVPLEQAEGKVLYVWFDAPIGYISSTKQWAEKNGKNWQEYWKSEDTKLVHFIGKDNIVFHCIIFPAMLKAHGEYIMPDNVPANEFLNLEGSKLSTSRNWAVWLDEYLVDFPDKQDSLRYALISTLPETKDNDFTWKDFQNRNNNELVAIFGNFINRVIVLTNKYYNGIVPQANLLEEDKKVLSQIPELTKKVASSIEKYRFREALSEMMNIARLGNKYLAETEPWKIQKQTPERVETILFVGLQISAALSTVCEPFLPFASKKLEGFLKIQKPNWSIIEQAQVLIPSGHQIGEGGLLFEKIEDSEIEKQIQKLEASKELNQTQNTKSKEPQKPEISYDDFSKMDIRIGTIIEAEAVPKAKKLLKLLIDTGIDKRTVVSGISESFSAEEVIGQKVCVLANLAPREIRGIVSQGMILMTEKPNGKLDFICPKTNQVQNGEQIS